MRHLAKLALILAFSTAYSFAETPQKMGIKTALSFAVEHSPDYDTSRLSKQISEMQLSSAKYSFLPTLEGSTEYGFRKELHDKENPGHVSAFKLTAKENLYDNGKSWTEYKMADLSNEVASIRLVKEREDLALTLLTAFVAYSKAVYLLEVRKTQYERLNVQYKLVTDEYQQGFKLKRDFLRFKAEVQKSRLSLSSSTNEVQKGAVELRRILGTPVDTPIEFVPLPITQKALNLPSQKLSIEENLDYKIGELMKKIESRKVDLVVRQNYPQLSLNGEISYGSADYWRREATVKDNDALNAAAMVTLSFTFWDWGTQRRAVGMARANERVQENAVKSTVLTAQAELENLRSELSNLKESYELARELQSLEESNYDYLVKEYREGRTTYIDLTTSLNTLLDAKSGFYGSYFDLILAVSRFKLFEGKLYDALQNDAVF